MRQRQPQKQNQQPANDPVSVKPFGSPVRRAMEYDSLASAETDRVTQEVYRQHAEHWHRIAKGQA